MEKRFRTFWVPKIAKKCPVLLWRLHDCFSTTIEIETLAGSSNLCLKSWPDLNSKRTRSWVEASLLEKVPRTMESTFSSTGGLRYGSKKAEIEKLWQELFSDPTEWRDHRLDNDNPRFPDFKHKNQTHKALWLNSGWIPPWVKGKLAAMPPGTIQLSAFLWNQKLSRSAQAGLYKETVELFQQMQQEGRTADRFTFVPVLNACASLGLLEHGRHIHGMMESCFEADLFIGSSLVDMYVKCGSTEEAERVFNLMPTRDVVTWTTMILGYVKCREGRKALELFEQMQQQEVSPDLVTFVGVLKACAILTAPEEGRHAHEEIIRRGYASNAIVGNCLVDMYTKCGSIEEAERVFNQMSTRNVVAWTAMILGYCKCGEGNKALELFEQMQLQGVDPEPVTFVGVLNACAGTAALEVGRCAHAEIIRRGYESDRIVGNCLIDMYAKCGSIEEAERVFNQMSTRDVVAWTAMILGYVNCGEGQKALELFEQMQHQGVAPDHVTFVGVLNACASVAALEGGKQVHEEIIQRGYDSEIVVGTCLIDMYAKCGSIEGAERVFHQLPTRNVTAWTAMLAGYGSHGYASKALQTFEQMCRSVEVDGVSFISLLSACNHGGFVDEGLDYFKSMTVDHNITPTVEHFTCVVDLLGRAGRLGEAEDLIMSMPMDPDTTVWMSLLGACSMHVNMEMGEHCAKEVLELDPENSAGYVLLSDIYVATCMWDSRVRVCKERLDRSLKKTLGRAWIEVNNKVHSFVSERSEHPQIMDIQGEINRLSGHMKDVGYTPDSKFLLCCVDKEEKESHLCLHSEMLAIAFGLISTAPGTPLCIVNNVRVCGNCHSAIKFIANTVGREMIVRDLNHIHQFKDGLCSCKDYW